MGRFLSARLVQGAIVILGVSVLVFVVTRLIGDPVNFILPLSASEEQRAALRADLGFDHPILTQFGTFIGDAVHLDFGDSTYFRNEAALDIVMRLPAQDAAARRRRDADRLPHIDPARRDRRPATRGTCSTSRSSRSASSGCRHRSSSSAR